MHFLGEDGVVLGDNLRSEVLPRRPACPSPFFAIRNERRVPAQAEPVAAKSCTTVNPPSRSK